MPPAADKNSAVNRPVYIIAIIIVLMAGLFLRVYDLEQDPPVDIGRFSQDLTTDPHHLTSFAANSANFGESEIYSFPKWRVFNVSLVSGFGYVLFGLGDTNRVFANLAGAIPSFIGIVFFVWGILAGTGRRKTISALIAAVFLSSNFLLIIYNRAPFLESGLIFYLGLIFLLFQKYQFKTFNLVILGFLVSLACLTGKVFGVTIGAALFLTILTSTEDRRVIKASGFVLTGFISAVLIILILYGKDFPAYWSYLREQSGSAHGSLLIFEGVRRFLARLLSYGTQMRLFLDSPFLFFGCYISVISILMYARRYFDSFQKSTGLRFSLYWLATLFFLLAPVNYRPLRYGILLLLPMVLIISLMFTLPPDSKPRKMPKPKSVLTAICLLMVNWFFLYHVIVDFFYIEISRAIGWRAVVWSILPALILTAVMISRIGNIIPKRIRLIGAVIGIMALASIIYQGARYYLWADNPKYSIRDASLDLKDLIGPDAVLTGPYAPTLTIDNDLKHFIYAFGLKKPEFNIFERFPITHLAVDQTNRQAALNDYPELKNGAAVTDYYLRNRGVYIVRIAQSSSNPASRSYIPTDYEKAMDFISSRQFDSALYYNDRFTQIIPDSRTGQLQRCMILARLKQYDRLLPLVNRIRADYPDDFAAQFFCATTLKRLALRLNRPDLMKTSEATLEAALELSDKKDFVRGKYDEVK